MDSQQEKRAKRLKRALEGWRELVLPLRSALAWERPWHPAAIFGSVTVVYLLIWALDPPPLSLLAGVGFVAVLADCLVPRIAPSVFPASAWTKGDERLLEETCRSAVVLADRLVALWTNFYGMRESGAKKYYAILISTLAVAAWIGARTDNLVLCYLSTLFALALPGLLSNPKIAALLQKINQKKSD